ncbi:MAG: thioredoxin [Chloroflexota bacterium]
MATLTKVSTQNFVDEVQASETPVFVDFYADWCGPCRAVAPAVEQLAAEYDGRLKVVKVDIDANPELADRFGVMSIPLLAIFKDGKIVQRISGAQPKDKLKKAIDTVLA